MKSKIQLGKKLSLNKETISKLNEDQMRKLAGGIGIEPCGTDGPKCSCSKKSCSGNEVLEHVTPVSGHGIA